MKRHAVIIVSCEEDLEKMNEQLEYTRDEPFQDNGIYPRYFKMNEMGLEEVVDNNGDVAKNPLYFMVTPA